MNRSTSDKAVKVIISGGGTGGHVFPAIAIADAIRKQLPSARILFVGAKGKLEMEKVPQAGYPIKGLWISGFQRKLSLKNLLFPLKLLWSLLRSWSIIRRFRPDVAVGVGGYASGPLLEVATRMGVPALIQEQNSYAGVTNRLLARKVARICVAYDQMDRFFPADKLVQTGNPVRGEFLAKAIDKSAAYQHFELNPELQTIFVFGGSLGAASINRAMAASLEHLEAAPGIQVIWQVGKLYYEQYRDSELARHARVRLLAFVDRMDLAYAVADLVVCRAGALTISELSLLGQPAILIPSPNVAEDHQTSNARALVAAKAAVLLADAEAQEQLLPLAQELLSDPARLASLSEHIQRMARPDAATNIAKAVLQLAPKDKGYATE